MQEFQIEFRRPQECPVVKLQLFCKALNRFEEFDALIDTGAAYSVIDSETFEQTGFDVIKGYKRNIGGFVPGYQECEYTGILTKLESFALKTVGFYVADLSETFYDVIIGMPFLKNFNFNFDFDIVSDYHGKIIFKPELKVVL